MVIVFKILFLGEVLFETKLEYFGVIAKLSLIRTSFGGGLRALTLQLLQYSSFYIENR